MVRPVGCRGSVGGVTYVPGPVAGVAKRGVVGHLALPVVVALATDVIVEPRHLYEPGVRHGVTVCGAGGGGPPLGWAAGGG